MRRLVLSILLASAALSAFAGQALAAQNLVGQVREFELGPGTHPQALVAGPDGNLWFAGIGYSGTEFTDVLGKVTPSGQVTADGALWVTGATAISRLATDGSSVTFPLPASIEYPNEIVTGPDGALWFGIQSRFGVGSTPGLGRMTTDGQVPSRRSPTARPGPSAPTRRHRSKSGSSARAGCAATSCSCPCAAA